MQLVHASTHIQKEESARLMLYSGPCELPMLRRSLMDGPCELPTKTKSRRADAIQLSRDNGYTEDNALMMLTTSHLWLKSPYQRARMLSEIPEPLYKIKKIVPKERDTAYPRHGCEILHAG
jgi:hypothetical protein